MTLVQSAGPVLASGQSPEAAAISMNIVIGGHVDHGKSTIVGRLLADTGSLPEGKLEQVKRTCERNAKPFEYAFLLDALKDEQAQGITIDAARVFFKTAKRNYVIIDAPGHIEFLKNMVTGASRAEAALLVIDAHEGVQENSRRHGYMMSMLGIRQIVVLVNKMDLADLSQARFDSIVKEYTEFLSRIDVTPACFIPVVGRDGDNVALRSDRMPWYQGPTVLTALDQFEVEPAAVDKPLRMPVQDVYKFTQQHDDRRIVAGTVETGSLRVGDEVVFYPSGKRGKVKTIEGFNREPPQVASAGEATGFTLTEQIYIGRGEMVTRLDESKPEVTTRLRVNLFWLGKQPLVKKREYQLKLGTARVPVRLETIHRVIDASNLASSEGKDRIDRHEVAECTLVVSRAIAFDRADQIAATSRFVLVDGYEIRGGGIIREALPDQQAGFREKVLLRNFKWEPSIIPIERRAERFSQRATLLLITGTRDTDRKGLGKDLEALLFQEGRLVYFLGMGSVVYGVDADIAQGTSSREHLRRLGEIANIMLDAGAILIVSAADLTLADLEVVKTSVDPARIEVVWVGDRLSTDIPYDLILSDAEISADGVERIKRLLQDKGVLFRPW